MRVPATPRVLEFACHSAACRPPGSGGTGGSGGGSGYTTSPHELATHEFRHFPESVIRTRSSHALALVAQTNTGPKLLGYAAAITKATEARARREGGKLLPIANGRVVVPAYKAVAKKTPPTDAEITKRNLATPGWSQRRARQGWSGPLT